MKRNSIGNYKWIVLALSLFFSFSVWGSESDLNVAISAKLNMTDNQEKLTDGVRAVLGESYEFGGSIFLAGLGLEVFSKKVGFEKVKKSTEGAETNHITFSDSLYGGGIHLAGKNMSLRAGKGIHNVVTKQKIAGQTATGWPNGRETGNYFGCGLYGTLPMDVDLTLDFTSYRLPASKYSINEVAVGIRFFVLGSGLPQKKGGK